MKGSTDQSGAFGFDDIQMADEEDRLRADFSAAGSVQPNDEIAFPRHGSENLDVGRGIARVTEANRHCFGSRRVIADGIGGVDLDELLQDIARERLWRGFVEPQAKAGETVRARGA